MRKLIVILLIGISLYSCKKGSDGVVPVVPPPYIGTYTSTTGDTAYFSQNGETYTKIRWCAMGNQAKINIDSVLVFPDNTFTVNQLVWYDSRWKLWLVREVLGLTLPDLTSYYTLQHVLTLKG